MGKNAQDMISAAVAQELYTFSLDRRVMRGEQGRTDTVYRSSCGGPGVPRRDAEQGPLGAVETGK